MHIHIWGEIPSTQSGYSLVMVFPQLPEKIHAHVPDRIFSYFHIELNLKNHVLTFLMAISCVLLNKVKKENLPQAFGQDISLLICGTTTAKI